MWQVYILKCADGTLYTGITTDLNRRVLEHNESFLGARYTRGRRPVRLIYSEKFNSRSLSLIEENRIKKLSREEKFNIIKAAK